MTVNFLSHSVITTPNEFIPHAKHKHGAFVIGTNSFHYSEANLRIIFSAANVSHCTTIPSPNTDIPKILMGEKSFKAVIQHEAIVKAYFKDAIISCVAFGYTNIGWKNNKNKPNKLKDSKSKRSC